MVRLLCFFLGALTLVAHAQSDLEFKAEYYERNLESNSIILRGKAWVKQGNKQVWADEIEIDQNRNVAIGNGNVKVVDGNNYIWADTANYSLSGDEAFFDEATMSSGAMVITGKVIRKVSRDKYEVEEGFYTNCNISLQKSPELSKCGYAWKLYGKHFSVTLEEYAQITDAVIYVANAPIFYTPYFVVPVKTKRQSGLLRMTFSSQSVLGQGYTLPFFWAISEWQDLTITPTYFSNVGYHVNLHHRYIYGGNTQGEFKFTLMERQFGSNRSAPNEDSAEKALGFLGEFSFYGKNRIRLGTRAYSVQRVQLVSDPYYPIQYATDLNTSVEATYLKSYAAYTLPMDHNIFSAKIQYDQNLIISEDLGVDGGPVAQLPNLRFSQTTTPLLSNWFSFEFDSQFTNYFRDRGFDSLDPNKTQSEYESTPFHIDNDGVFSEGDYLRTGRRLWLEPRLVSHLPMPPGFALQPILKAGGLLYHFDSSESKTAHQEYLDIEIPLSLYLSKTFSPGWENFEKINHVFQPRIVYGASLFRNSSDHPFFYKNTTRNVINPRFDYQDDRTPFEYMRVELINRFRKKSGNSVNRFLLAQLSNQFNFQTTDNDIRFSRKVGPLELLLELEINRFYAQIEAKYQWETTNSPNLLSKKHEYDWSSTMGYRISDANYIRLNNRFRIRADVTKQEQYASIEWAKSLPIFFDLDGRVEYNFQKGELGAYQIGFVFGEKPVSCWNIRVTTGRNPSRELFANFAFRLNFGSPGHVL